MEREIELEVHTFDPLLASRLVGRPEAKRGDEIEIADQVHLRFKGKRGYRGVGASEILVFTLQFVSSATASYLASVIYAHFHNIEKIEFKPGDDNTAATARELNELGAPISNERDEEDLFQ